MQINAQDTACFALSVEMEGVGVGVGGRGDVLPMEANRSLRLRTPGLTAGSGRAFHPQAALPGSPHSSCLFGSGGHIESIGMSRVLRKRQAKTC